AAPSLISSVGFTDPALFSEEALPEGVRVEVGTAETDFEPEFITVSPDGTTAFVALQENNAIAVLDIESGAFTGIFSTGIVDRSVEGQGFDPIEDSVIDITTFDDIVSLRQPDTIKATEINGDTFVLTANEGDGRDDPEFGDPLTVNELRVRDLLNVELEHDLIARGLIAEEPFAFDEEGDPDREPIGIEELEVSQFDGLDAHGRVELLHTYGSRSFTIWDAHGNVVFDSGDEFEKIIAERAPGRFNDDDGDSGEDRSNDAGPEPEALEVGVIGDRTYAFIGLERDSGIMIYDITDPANAFFVNYIDPAFVGLTPEDEVARHSPEGIVFIPAEESTTGFAQIAVSYEFSGSTVVFDLPQLSLNEIRSDQGGPDNNEYIEIFGAAGTSLNGFSFVA
ncbi:MAG: choice-of-anchor I family protein, partial [Pseudomonadota bacterium]